MTERTPKSTAPLLPRLILLSALIGAGSCSPNSSPPEGRDAPADWSESSESQGAPLPAGRLFGVPDQAVLDEVADVLRTLNPPDPTATSDLHHAWLDRRRATLARMHEADDRLGRALAQHLVDSPALPSLVADGVLTAAAYAAPDDLVPLLVEAVEEYGGGPLRLDLGQRGRAAELLADVAPERAVEVLEPILLSQGVAQTRPSLETLLRAWIAASEAIDHSTETSLVMIATDIRLGEATRHLAVRELGELTSDLVTQALVEVLTESTGNAYLRRLAAQSIVRSLPTVEAIEQITQVLEREADIGMQNFLLRVLDDLEADLR